MKHSAVIIGLCVIEVVIGVSLARWTDHRRIETSDFLNFYAAATIVSSGHGHELYNPVTQQDALQNILGRRVAEFYLHPPFEAAALVPFTWLRIETAFVAWTVFNLALLGVLPLILTKTVSLVARKPHLCLLSFVFPPVLATITLGQDCILVLFFLACTYELLTEGNEFAAGLLLAPATIKFQYVTLVALFLMFLRRSRLLIGFAVGCVLLILVSALVVGPRGLIEYAYFVHRFDVHNGYGNISVDRLMNLRGFLAGLGFSDHLRLYGSLCTASLVLLAFICSRWAKRNENLTFSLFVSIALLASPYSYFQDLTILLLPILLVSDAVWKRQIIGVNAKLLCLWMGMFFVWPATLLWFGGHYFWNSRIYLVVPLVLLFTVNLGVELFLTKENS